MGKLTKKQIEDSIRKDLKGEKIKGFKMVPGVAKDMAKLNIGGSGYEPSFLEDKILWPLERAWDWIEGIPRNIKFFIQRGRKGYSTKDTWDLHGYLSMVIAGSIRQLRDKTVSYPSNMTPKEWSKILTKIANGFEKGEESVDLAIQERKKKRLEKEFVEAFELFGKVYFNLWD